jgi:hypothetical protein
MTRSHCWTILLQQCEPRSLLAPNNDFGHHCCLWYHCCICYPFRGGVIQVHSSFEPWLSNKQHADVTATDMAWRTHLEFPCTPKSTPFQSCFYVTTAWYYVSMQLTEAANGPIVRPSDMSEYGAAAEWYWQGKTEGIGEKPLPVPLCPPQIPHGLPWERTGTSAARSQRLREIRLEGVDWIHLAQDRDSSGILWTR